MSYADVARKATDTYRLPYEASQHDETVVVVGEPSSGTRLASRLIRASGLPTVHDMYHGTRRWTSGRAVIVTRDPEARAESVVARWPDGLPGEYPTVDQLRAAYPDALEVAYEDVVADKDAVIVELAAALGVEPWLFDEEVFDGNAEPGTREGQGPPRPPGMDEGRP